MKNYKMLVTTSICFNFIIRQVVAEMKHISCWLILYGTLSAPRSKRSSETWKICTLFWGWLTLSLSGIRMVNYFLIHNLHIFGRHNFETRCRKILTYYAQVTFRPTPSTHLMTRSLLHTITSWANIFLLKQKQDISESMPQMTYNFHEGSTRKYCSTNLGLKRKQFVITMPSSFSSQRWVFKSLPF